MSEVITKEYLEKIKADLERALLLTEGRVFQDEIVGIINRLIGYVEGGIEVIDLTQNN